MIQSGVYYPYVTDDNRKLVSVVSLRQLSIPDIGEIASNHVNGCLCISGSHNGDIAAPPTWAHLL